jgi:hypothetical protein
MAASFCNAARKAGSLGMNMMTKSGELSRRWYSLRPSSLTCWRTEAVWAARQRRRSSSVSAEV